MLVVALGKTVRSILDQFRRQGLRFPRVETVQHYSYVALHPRGNQGPMHPERVHEYDLEFAEIASLYRRLQLGAA
jgi:hypothetical protein